MNEWMNELMNNLAWILLKHFIIIINIIIVLFFLSLFYFSFYIYIYIYIEYRP